MKKSAMNRFAKPTGRASSFGTVVAVVGLLLLLWLTYSAAEILLLFFVSILIAVYLETIADLLERYLHLHRWIGILVGLLGTFAIVAGVGYLIVPVALTQLTELIFVLPELLTGWDAKVLRAVQRYPPLYAAWPASESGGLAGSLAGWVGGYVQDMFGYLSDGVTLGIHLASVLIMSIYLALQPERYREGVIALIPPIQRDLARDISVDLTQTLRSWVVGQLVSMSVLGLLSYLGLAALGVPYALAFGLLTGVAAIVPFFGTLVATILPAIVALGVGSPFQALLVLILGTVIHLVEGNIIQPLVMARQVHLPPVLSILAILIMAKLLGVIGLMVAVPVAAVCLVIVRRLYTERVLVGKGFRRSLRVDPPADSSPQDPLAPLDPAGGEPAIRGGPAAAGDA